MDYPLNEGSIDALATGAEAEVNLAAVSSAALTRLVEEVRNNDVAMGGYDRVHNRHNR
ncbi:YhhA family cyclophane-containing RiPP [Stenotrophomonas sp. MYb57]|uniref:YhhA family cyclophane-containing RiPP n=1 Tax=Stenotrophomonas sp. MYb57 TaxID=1827305 RepID=UPI001319D14D|nr:YhhA family cyclophane-containing RiPP [Stenotrophomonas sp. MYb57]